MEEVTRLVEVAREHEVSTKNVLTLEHGRFFSSCCSLDSPISSTHLDMSRQPLQLRNGVREGAPEKGLCTFK